MITAHMESGNTCKTILHFLCISLGVYLSVDWYLLLLNS